MSPRFRQVLENSLVVLTTVTLALLFLFPLLWMVSTALKPTETVFRVPPRFFSDNFSFDAFIQVWSTRPMGTFFFNSAVIAVAVTATATILAFVAAYGFSRFRFRTKGALLAFILTTQMLPEVLLVTPYFIMMARWGLINTRLSLMLAYTTFALPFCTWMLKGFVDSLPRELDEAALIDGCSRIQILWKIITPLSLPGLGVTVLFGLLLSWNHYLFAMVLTTKESLYTFPMGIASFIGEYITTWNQVMAGALIGIMPILVSAAVLERYLVAGLAAGAVKQ